MKEQNSAIWPTSPRTSPRQLGQGGSVWVRILFEGYYWKSEAKMKERRKTNKRGRIAELGPGRMFDHQSRPLQ